ncbi:aspartate aminotransferase family protein [Desertibacillus haloalkaliphilus]|uniref:aspartate aminotransferase family protein n=1 Tax=Desertibacillus haloalkaliphilus TaxID=1328930 RepID=UPI001C252714|nr:aspartate aminotransferase family protein [Desertibacillus haloalkaliphilus]MBU8908386.1 aspartate aminotransferase family protein [Desertibacillus haloalkaliphilus]
MAIKKIDHPMLEFIEKTEGSYAFMEKAKEVMPGGVTANIKSFAPYPLVMKKAKGAYVTDVDGNDYIDYLLSYGALMLGHGHKAIQDAVIKQFQDNGTCLFGTPHELEYKMGKKIKEHYPSIDLLRYTNSGTEATLLALRLAAAYTGKNKIAKFEGHYHGGYDQVLLSVSPSLQEAGDENHPAPVVESSGVDAYHEEHTIILPFNNLDACKTILSKHKDEIGAVMIEPVQGGFIPAEQSFMDGLRKLTEELGIVLIFDEVKTGFRLGLGGAQSIYGITPDLTTLGKVVGGGYPIGIVGGTEEIMMVSSPTSSSDVFDSSQSKTSSAKDVLFHSGTYNGHPTILAAGLATIEVLEKEIDHVFEMTNQLKSRLEELFNSRGIPMKAVGMGSIFSVVLTNKEKILNYRDLQQTDLSTRKEIDLHLLNEGIYTKPLNRYSLSTAHTMKEVEKTVKAYDKVLTKLFGGTRF